MGDVIIPPQITKKPYKVATSENKVTATMAMVIQNLISDLSLKNLATKTLGNESKKGLLKLKHNVNLEYMMPYLLHQGRTR